MYNKQCRTAPRWTRSHNIGINACSVLRRNMYNSHCRTAPRWTCSQYYWYSRLLYTGDVVSIRITAGPLQAVHVLIATGGRSSLLETLHVQSEAKSNSTKIFSHRL